MKRANNQKLKKRKSRYNNVFPHRNNSWRAQFGNIRFIAQNERTAAYRLNKICKKKGRKIPNPQLDIYKYISFIKSLGTFRGTYLLHDGTRIYARHDNPKICAQILNKEATNRGAAPIITNVRPLRSPRKKTRKRKPETPQTREGSRKKKKVDQNRPSKKKKKKSQNEEPPQSIYAGVSWYMPLSKWSANRHGRGKNHFGGYFSDELQAARRSDELLQELGSNGRLNFTDEYSVPRSRKKSTNQKCSKL